MLEEMDYAENSLGTQSRNPSEGSGEVEMDIVEQIARSATATMEIKPERIVNFEGQYHMEKRTSEASSRFSVGFNQSQLMLSTSIDESALAAMNQLAMFSPQEGEKTIITLDDLKECGQDRPVERPT